MEFGLGHLGQHLIKTDNINSYYVFSTNYFNINIIADFKDTKSILYYAHQDYTSIKLEQRLYQLWIKEYYNK